MAKGKHPMKADLKKLIPVIEEQLIIRGTNSSQIREIANRLGIEAGVVMKVKNMMAYRNMILKKKDESPSDVITEEPITEVQDETTAADVSSPSQTDQPEEHSSTIDNATEQKKRKTRVFLTEAQEQEIYEHLVSKEFTRKELAELYNVSESKISRIYTEKGDTMGKKKMARTRQREEIKAELEFFATIKFVAFIPLFSQAINDKNIIWAISKNNDYHDLREDVTVVKKEDMQMINLLRDRYFLVSIVNGEIHLIDYWDTETKSLSLYSSKEKSMISDIKGYDRFYEVIYSIIKYDNGVERSRLRLNDFVADQKKFGELHKIFGLNKFSFNIISKDDVESVEAGLIADRHDGMPVEKFIFSSSFDEELMFNYNEQERIVKKFLAEVFDLPDSTKVKQLKLYVTGMQSAYGAVMKACVDLGVNLVTMHYNAKSKTYIPQYINGDINDTGAYIKAFDKLKAQKSLRGEILLFNCNYEDFSETNVPMFYIMELAKMKNQSSTENTKEESIIIIFKKKEDIWKVYPTVLDHIIDNDGLNLAMWVTTARIKDNNLGWGMNIVKSFNYK